MPEGHDEPSRWQARLASEHATPPLTGDLTIPRRTSSFVFERGALPCHLLPVLGGRGFEGELDRSWGGLSVLGATVAHWAVAAATIAVVYAVIVLMERLATSRRGAGTAVGSG
jgi:hypothetical protein